MNDNNNFYSQAAKYALIDLHLHLDGSMTTQEVLEMSKMCTVSLPTTEITELDELLKCPEHCSDLNDYLKCFDLPLKVLQTKETIRFAVASLLKRLANSGLLYAEVRFAPQLHLMKGLSQTQVVESAVEGLHDALSDRGGKFTAQLILCCMRGKDNDTQNMETVRTAESFLGRGVCACDLAGAEGLFKTDRYKGLFQEACRLGVPFTIHAGEAEGVSSVEYAVSYGAKRVGHGIRAFDDERVKRMLSEKGVTLELCPTSNLDTKALNGVTSYEQYPIQQFLKSNVPITINTDNMTVSNTTLRKEFERLFEAGVITTEDAHRLVKNAVDASFQTEEQKAQLLQACLSVMEQE